MSEDSLRIAKLEAALELIAAPVRPDGTYNRSREACEQIAKEALAESRRLRTFALNPDDLEIKTVWIGPESHRKATVAVRHKPSGFVAEISDASRLRAQERAFEIVRRYVARPGAEFP